MRTLDLIWVTWGVIKNVGLIVLYQNGVLHVVHTKQNTLANKVEVYETELFSLIWNEDSVIDQEIMDAKNIIRKHASAPSQVKNGVSHGGTEAVRMVIN